MTGLFLAGRWHSKNPLRQIISHLVVSQRRFVALNFRFCSANFSSHNTGNLSPLPKEKEVACLAWIQTA